MTLPPIRPFARLLTVFLTAVLLSVMLLTANLHFLLSPAYVAWQYSLRHEPGRAALDTDKATPIISYLSRKTDEPPPMTVQERSHLADVRHLFELASYIAITSALILAFTLWTIKRIAGARELQRTLGLAAAAGSVCLGFFLLAAAINFNWIFNRFHLILFDADSWLFSPDSTLIRLFPLDFWFRAAGDWALLTLLELAVVGVVSFIVYGRGRVAQ
jgi:integral membrane protein (TIGR01906 family)